MGEFINFLGNNLADFWTYTGFANATVGHIVMILIGLFFIYLAVAKEFEPMLLIPIGFGILIGNIPFNMEAGLKVGIYEEGSVLNILYQGVTSGWYPPLIFLGIGAMTDFSALISNPKLMLIGAAAQFGIFGAYMIALAMGFDPMQAGAIGIIGGADGPTAIFLSSKLAPNLMGAIAVSAYSYMALVPVIQPPIMRLLTTKHERLIRMKPPRVVSHTEKVMFPIIGLLLTCFLVPSGLPLLGMLFFGNLLKESGVTRRLAETARGPLIDTITILFCKLQILRLFGCEHKLQVHSHSVCQTLQQLQRWVACSIFQLADIRLIDAGAFGQLLLGQVLRNACICHRPDDIHFRLVLFPLLAELLIFQLFIQIQIQCFHLIHPLFPKNLPQGAGHQWIFC